MGNTLLRSSHPQKEATLLQPAIAGDLDKIKKEIGEFLATYSTSTDSSTAPSYESKLHTFVNQQDGEGNNAIHGAVFADHTNIVKYLTESCGASLETQNNLGCSPLWLAAGYNRSDILEYIINNIEDPKKSILDTNNTGDTPLIAAASKGNLDTCQILLKESEKYGIVKEIMSASNHNGDTPLKVAVALQQQSNENLVELLLNYADEDSLNTVNNKGLTPLLVACERDNKKVVQDLLNHPKINVNISDSSGSSPAAVASFCGSKDALEILLLKNQELLEKPNSNGCTPLWLAARSGRPEVVVILLKAGADPNHKNNDGLSPIDVARKHKRVKVLELFEQKSAVAPYEKYQQEKQS